MERKFEEKLERERKEMEVEYLKEQQVSAAHRSTLTVPLRRIAKLLCGFKSMKRRKRHRKTATWSKPSLLSRSHSLSLQLQGAGESGSTTFFLFRIKVQSFEKDGSKRLGEETKGSERLPGTDSKSLSIGGDSSCQIKA
jgi:hypothetical protein